MKIIKITVIIISAFLLLVNPVELFAHGSGASLEKEVNGYFVDIGYEPEVITTSEPVVLDFIIKSREDEEVPFTHVWLKVSSNDEIYFASGIARAQFGKTTAMLRLPKAGEYKIEVRFSNESTQIAETQFSLPVSEIQMENTTPDQRTLSLMPLVVGFIFGLIPALGITYVWKNHKKE